MNSAVQYPLLWLADIIIFTVVATLLTTHGQNAILGNHNNPNHSFPYGKHTDFTLGETPFWQLKKRKKKKRTLTKLQLT